jgi:hypothetical protein
MTSAHQNSDHQFLNPGCFTLTSEIQTLHIKKREGDVHSVRKDALPGFCLWFPITCGPDNVPGVSCR